MVRLMKDVRVWVTVSAALISIKAFIPLIITFLCANGCGHQFSYVMVIVPLLKAMKSRWFRNNKQNNLKRFPDLTPYVSICQAFHGTGGRHEGLRSGRPNFLMPMGLGDFWCVSLWDGRSFFQRKQQLLTHFDTFFTHFSNDHVKTC